MSGNTKSLLGMLFVWHSSKPGECNICGQYSEEKLTRLSVYVEPVRRDMSKTDVEHEELLDSIFNSVADDQRAGHFDVVGNRKICDQCAGRLLDMQSLSKTTVFNALMKQEPPTDYSAVVSLFDAGDISMHQVLLISGQGEADKSYILHTARIRGYQKSGTIYVHIPHSEN